jgi:hypothetical protein
MRKRSRIVKRSVGGVNAVIAKELNDFWTLSVPDRGVEGFYLQTMRHVPTRDIDALLDCIAELRNQV